MDFLEELLVALGFEYDPKELDEFRNDVKSTTDLISGLVKFAAGGAAALTALTVTTTAASDAQGKLGEEIGETAGQIDALQQALVLSGGSAEGMSSSLKTLSIRASESARGVGGGVEAFGLLGISAVDTNGKIKRTSDLLLEVSGKLQGLDKARQIELADKLGLGESIRLLQQGPAAIQRYISEIEAIGVTTQEDARLSAEFADSLTMVWQVIKQISRVIVRSLAPAMKSINEALVDWWKANREIIELNMPKWIDMATKAIKILSTAIVVFLGLKILTHLSALIALFRSASLAALVFNGIMLALPVLISAAIASVIALMEDAKTLFEGGDSLLGKMMEDFPEYRDLIISVASAFATLGDMVAMSFKGLNDLIGLFKNSTFEDFKEFIGNLPGFIGSLIGIEETPVKVGVEYEPSTLDNIRDFIFGGGPEQMGVIGSSPITPISPSQLQPINNQNNQSNVNSTNSTTSVDTMNINIQSNNADPKDVANSVYNKFQQSIQDVETSVDI